MVHFSSFCLLPERGFLTVAGPEAFSFLQRLVTKDLTGIKAENIVFSALLSPQGKVLFDFFIYQSQPDFFILEADAQLIEPLKDKLLMYRLGSKLEIGALSWRVGVALNEAAKEQTDLLFKDPRCAQLGWRVWLKHASADLQETLALDVYHQHCLRLGVAQVGRDFPSGLLTPFHVNYDFLNGLDCKKGCFVGQEVVARMKNRAMVKKRLFPQQGEDGHFRLVEMTIPPWLPALKTAGCAPCDTI